MGATSFSTGSAAGISQANQAALEAETNQDTYAPPDLLKHSPGVAKAWVSIVSAGTIETPDYGVASITDSGTGDRSIVFSTAFSSAVYSVTSTVTNSTVQCFVGHNDEIATGTCRVLVENASASRVDQATCHAFHGDQ